MQSKQVGLILGGIAALVLIVGGIVLLGHKSSPAPAPATPSSSPRQTDQVTPGEVKSVTVNIQDFSFQPSPLTVKKGATVTWTNQDSVGHSVVSDEGSPAGGPNGPLIGKGQTYSFTFDKVGTFTYHCTPHPSMHGTVTVTL